MSTQPDFLRGAAMSKGGKPIVCLRSTTLDGKESLIRPGLLSGEGVGISRSDMHYVVTEYGMAYLFGKSIRERALSIIEIAAPNCVPGFWKRANGWVICLPRRLSNPKKPYLIGEERLVHLKNGKTVRLRPARASDMDAILELFYALTPEDIYTRFFQRLKNLTFNQSKQFCDVSFENEAAFIAVAGDRENEKAVGSSCHFLDPSTNAAEIGFMIAADWQGIGLGRALQDQIRVSMPSGKAFAGSCHQFWIQTIK